MKLMCELQKRIFLTVATLACTFSTLALSQTLLSTSHGTHLPLQKKVSQSVNQPFRYDWGFGVRIGDPTGLSLKKYWAGSALEFNVGRTAILSFYDYERAFHRRYDDGFRNYDYLDYRVRSAISIQLHYLIHNPLRLERTTGLSWYYGAGGQLAFLSLVYAYRYRLYYGPGFNDYYWVYTDGDPVRETDIGMDGVIGLEYKFVRAPIVLFIDATLFMELVHDPFVLRGLVGLGGRYLF